MANGSEMIVQFLEEAGIEYVFGIPGGGTGQIYNLLYGKEDTIKTIVCRHEQACGHYGGCLRQSHRKTGRYHGPGAVHGLMPPLALWSHAEQFTHGGNHRTSDGGVAMHPANQSAAGEYGSIDITAIFKTMTKYTRWPPTAKRPPWAHSWQSNTPLPDGRAQPRWSCGPPPSVRKWT